MEPGETRRIFEGCLSSLHRRGGTRQASRGHLIARKIVRTRRKEGRAVIKDPFQRFRQLKSQKRRYAALLVILAFALRGPVAYTQPENVTALFESAGTVALPPQELDSLVAPIALYPDPLLSQVLVAATYPQEILAAEQWLRQHPNLQGLALVDAVASQPWDPSIQALAAFPQVLQMLAQNIEWTGQLGQAFLSQQAGVFDAVQRMRQQAQQQGKLQSTPQQTVNTVTENGQTYIQILPANPQTVYVPQYEPAAIWGPAPGYPYPQVVYPSTGALITSGLLSFGAGVAVGALFPGGGWGWYPGWGSHTVIVNRNFIDRHHFNPALAGRGGSWVHNPVHGRWQGGRQFGQRGSPSANRPGQLRPPQGGAARQINPGMRLNPAAPGRGEAQRLGPGIAPWQRPGGAPMPQMRPLPRGPRPSPGFAPGMGRVGPRQGGAQRYSAPRSFPHREGRRMGGGHRR
jgi:hypothetical protein